MTITREQVLHVAKLAQLGLSEEEVTRFSEQLSAILESVGKIAELDLAGIEPTSHPLDIVNAFGEDEPVVAGARGRARQRSRPGGRVVRGADPVIDTLRLTAREANDLLTLGDASAAELHAAYLGRDDELHAYLRQTEYAGAEGIPIAYKDLVSTKGVETTAGSKILAGYVPVYDATVVDRCRARGLSMLGKTNMDEFAMGSSTENSAYGPTLNPWDLSRVPGGSSGGSAAAVAGGLAPWALGSDTGGSIKQPAALCGVVGLRPTYGTVSRYGIVAFASSLDQIGPITKTVADCAFLYSVIAGRDPRDTTTVDLPAPVEVPRATDLSGLRVGVPKQLNEVEGIEPGVKEAVARAIALCEKLGAEVDDCELPLSVEYGLACYYLIAPSEASSNLAVTTACALARAPRAEGGATSRSRNGRATKASATSPSGASCLARTRYPPAITTRSTGRPRRCAR